jgi:hypothetical protein
MQKEAQTAISWSYNEAFLKMFHENFDNCQKALRISRTQIQFLPDAFDFACDVWRLEKPYTTKGEQKKMEKLKINLTVLMDNYRNAREENFKSLNFRSRYALLEEFLNELTSLAVRRGFYPTIVKKRSIEDKYTALGSQ